MYCVIHMQIQKLFLVSQMKKLFVNLLFDQDKHLLQLYVTGHACVCLSVCLSILHRCSPGCWTSQVWDPTVSCSPETWAESKTLWSTAATLLSRLQCILLLTQVLGSLFLITENTSGLLSKCHQAWFKSCCWQ